MDFFTSAEEKKLAGDMRAMAVDIENSPPSMRNLACLGFKMLSVRDANLIIGPPFF